jgi:hypothetical protein
VEIDRRGLLKATACLALTGLAGPSEASTRADADAVPSAPAWHPLTRSLLDRARRASLVDRRADTSRVERIIRETARAQGRATPPVIKWLAGPSDAFDHLSRYGLDALLRMGTASLWRRAAPSVSFDDRSLDLSFVLGGLIAGIVGVEGHDPDGAKAARQVDGDGGERVRRSCLRGPSRRRPDRLAGNLHVGRCRPSRRQRQTPPILGLLRARRVITSSVEGL